MLTSRISMLVRLPPTNVPAFHVLTVVLILQCPAASTVHGAMKKSGISTRVQLWPPQSSSVTRMLAARLSSMPFVQLVRPTTRAWTSRSPSSLVPGALSGPLGMALILNLPLPTLEKSHWVVPGTAGMHAGKPFDVVVLAVRHWLWDLRNSPFTCFASNG